MPKSSPSLAMLPPEALASLARLGENLALARVRRKESQRQWAQRLGVSAPTLIRMERGDPSVSAGLYAGALWLMGRAQALGEIADPIHDLGALEADVRNARQTRAVRSKASISAGLKKSVQSQ
ncbi:MAG: helix-turn-helix transcriptional regulator [Betaproteobacteria bacterium]|nr:helix-turn-helix transcriptional regulator [Betaproteobacteria bacterium]